MSGIASRSVDTSFISFVEPSNNEITASRYVLYV